MPHEVHRLPDFWRCRRWSENLFATPVVQVMVFIAVQAVALSSYSVYDTHPTVQLGDFRMHRSAGFAKVSRLKSLAFAAVAQATANAAVRADTFTAGGSSLINAIVSPKFRG